MTYSPPRLVLGTALSLIALLGVSACSSTAPAPTETGAAEETPAGFPRTIEIPGRDGAPGSTLAIETEPHAIAALDYESAEVIAELGYADKLVLVPEAVLNPAIGGHVDEMEQVPTTFPVAMELDAETVIAANPDLVVVTPRHGADEKIGDVLENAGVPTLTLPAPWTNVRQLNENIALVGEAIGAEREAGKLTDTLSSGLAQTEEPTGASNVANPRVLLLTNQAGRPFITAGSAFPLQLLELAGAQSVSEELGIRVTGPISIEQIIEADPDGIVLIDMNGTGDRMFADILNHPAITEMSGASGDRLLRVGGREVQALGLGDTIGGLERLRDWVQTLS